VSERRCDIVQDDNEALSFLGRASPRELRRLVSTRLSINRANVDAILQKRVDGAERQKMVVLKRRAGQRELFFVILGRLGDCTCGQKSNYKAG
jgi:hypothetical protein